ncbi:Fmt Methionyl-tRNA formyltransferase [Candidatus Nanopelagicaceae bacterium]
MRLAVAASPEVAIPTLNALLESEHNLVRVISQPDRPAGRGKTLTPTAVSQWAQEKGISLARPESKDEIAAHIDGVDCVITIGYGVLIPEPILSIPQYGFLNLHFSLLPRWRGAAPVQRAIEARDSVSGVTVFKLDAGMDTGPVYTVHRFALDGDITSDELFIELGELGVGAVLETIEKISQGAKPTPQNNDGATRALKLTREEAQIDWNLPAEVVSAKVRAFTSHPGAWTLFRGSPIKVATPVISNEALKPGEVKVIAKKIYIGTESQALQITHITPVGKAQMDAFAWANGARLTEGELCE